MTWETQLEEVSIDLGQGRSVRGNVPHLVNQDGVELRLVGALGDDITISYKDQQLEGGITLGIPAVRFLSPGGQLVEVLLYHAVNQESCFDRMSAKTMTDAVTTITNNLVQAITALPKFFHVDIEKHGMITDFRIVLSSLRRWPELKHLIAFAGVV